MTKDLELERLKREAEDCEREAEDLEAFSLHFKRMVRTIGNSPPRQLKWLLDFLYSDLSSLKEDKRLAFRCALAFLAWYGNLNFKKQPPILSGEKRFYLLSLVRFASGRLPVESLEKYQKDFFQKVSAFLEQHHVQFPLHPPLNSLSKSTIHVRNNPGKKPVLYLDCSTGDESLQWWLASLLTDQGSKLRRCLQCQNISIAKRTDAKFCSNKCRGLYNIRQRRKTPVDRYGKQGRPKKNDEKSKKKG